MGQYINVFRSTLLVMQHVSIASACSVTTVTPTHHNHSQFYI